MTGNASKQGPHREFEQGERNLQRYQKMYEMLDRNSPHWTEIKILSYLYSHGNTREEDLTAYAIRTLNKSANSIGKTLNRMAKEKKIKRIVHKKLEHPAVYFVEGDIADYDFDLWTLAGIDRNGDIERYRKAIKNELRKNRKNKLQ
jgi:hypothetical protein